VTAAAPPQQTAFTGLSTDFITVNWNPGQNPSDTQFLAEISLSSSPFVTEDSSSTLAAYASFGSLSQNTTYYPRVTAFNRRGLTAGPVYFTPMATLAGNPVPAAFSLGSSSVTLNWGEGTNPLPPETFYLAEISSNTDFAAPVISSVTTALNASFQDLVSNTTWYLRVSALSHTGVPTQPVSLGEALTYPATPMLLSGATFSFIMLDALTLNWTKNGNSSMTVYEVEISTGSDFGLPASSGSTLSESLAFTGLAPGTTYHARVKAVGLAGLASPWSLSDSTRTLSETRQTAVYTQPTTAVLKTSYGDISVMIPAGTFGSSVKVTLTTASSLPAAPSPAAALIPTGMGVVITVEPKFQPNKLVTITVPYRPSQMAGLDRRALVLAIYDPAGKVWAPLPSVSNTSDNTVTAQTWHLSTFQIMQSLAPAGLAGAKIFPNPFKPSSGKGMVQFSNIPAAARVKIYTLLGELVKELRADSNGIALWYGTNRWGAKAASGVYLVLLEKEDGSGRMVTKLAVER
ncbi:MAG: fibronectin type III domain-containing protein, partial [bacterium]